MQQPPLNRSKHFTRHWSRYVFDWTEKLSFFIGVRVGGDGQGLRRVMYSFPPPPPPTPPNTPAGQGLPGRPSVHRRGDGSGHAGTGRQARFGGDAEPALPQKVRFGVCVPLPRVCIVNVCAEILNTSTPSKTSNTENTWPTVLILKQPLRRACSSARNWSGWPPANPWRLLTRAGRKEGRRRRGTGRETNEIG